QHDNNCSGHGPWPKQGGVDILLVPFDLDAIAASRLKGCGAFNKPSLRRRTQTPDANNKDDDDNDQTTTSRKTSKDKKDSSKESKVDSTKAEDQEPSDDDRPKLKRRDQQSLFTQYHATFTRFCESILGLRL